MLPDEAIKEFQLLYKKEFGLKLSEDQSKDKAENFIQLFDLITNKNKDNNNEENCGITLHSNT